MRVAVCIDDLGGMTFNRRRQSRDRVLLADLLAEVKEGRLLISPFSEDLFADKEATATRLFLGIARREDLCFAEDAALAPYLSRIDELILYRWNCRYPRDRVLDIDPLAAGMRLAETVELAGHSHEKITKERYVR